MAEQRSNKIEESRTILTTLNKA